VTIILQYCI